MDEPLSRFERRVLEMCAGHQPAQSGGAIMQALESLRSRGLIAGSACEPTKFGRVLLSQHKSDE